MLHIGLDLSIASTGICIVDDAKLSCTLIRLTDKYYERSFDKNKWNKSLLNGINIADAICKQLMAFRQPMLVNIESVGFGLLRQRTNSASELMFEGAVVAAALRRCFDCRIGFIEPSKHKLAFTGSGRATKEQSIATMLNYVDAVGKTDKLDDIADAMSIANMSFKYWQKIVHWHVR